MAGPDKHPAGPAQRPPGLDSPRTVRIIKALSAANVRLYRVTRGRIGGTWRVGSAFPRGIPVCLLTTTGRKTGQARTLPLVFLREGERSPGGLPRRPAAQPDAVPEPAANPEVTVQVRGRVQAMHARTASATERDELWPKLVDLYADFDNYAAWTEREIPVVLCEPPARSH